MEVGGSQLNAIEMAAALQALGHTLILVAEDGRMVPTAERLGLERFAVSRRRGRPSLAVMRQLCGLARNRGVDVIHGYEWPPVLDGWLGPHLRLGTPVVATVYSAAVAPFLPRSIPLIVGVEELRRQCCSDGFRASYLIEPPVNVQENSPAIDGADFRRRHQVGEREVLVVMVCRLARELKLEGLTAACRVIAKMAKAGANVRLAIVGDGPVRDLVAEEASRGNEISSKQNVIFLTGELLDPRGAYAAADIVLGMGGSALRGMAFGKPLIVQGEAGFWKTCDPESVSQFLNAGWYGLGSGESGDAALHAALKPLLVDVNLRQRLGWFGRQLVVERFSLERAARTLLGIYDRAIVEARKPTPRQVAMTVWGVSKHNTSRRWASLRGAASRDDFNAIGAQATASNRAAVSSGRQY